MSDDMAMVMNPIEAKRRMKEAALRFAIREIVREELAKSQRRVCEIDPVDPNSKIAGARDVIQSAVIASNIKHGIPPTKEEAKIADALKKIKEALALPTRPKEIILGECWEANDSNAEYAWWKNFLWGLKLFPYVFDTRFVTNGCEHRISCSCHHEVLLRLDV